MLENGRWVPTFPKARHLIGRAELAHWQAEGDAAQQVILGSVQPIFDAGLAELVESDQSMEAKDGGPSTSGPDDSPGKDARSVGGGKELSAISIGSASALSRRRWGSGRPAPRQPAGRPQC